MKIEELRVGNLIYFPFHNENVKVLGLGLKNDLSKLIQVETKGTILMDRLICFKRIPLTEEWLLKFGFENWGEGSLYSNEYESYTRYVLYNVIDGTSNFEVHFINSRYGGLNHFQYVISCDEDERINFGSEMEYLHQLQNLYFALTGQELCEAK